MLAAKQTILDAIESPVQRIRARVELYNGSTLVDIYSDADFLQDFAIERIGDEGKFFGFGICQKLSANFLDLERAVNISKSEMVEIEFGAANDFIYTAPPFYVEEVSRDENTNTLSVVGYDALYKAKSYTVDDIPLTAPYTLRDFATACATLLGLPLAVFDHSVWGTVYQEGGNFSGTESLRAALDAVAEATQSIYYIDNEWRLTFRRLDLSGSVLSITKDQYIELQSGTTYTLGKISSVTELGDNYSAHTSLEGVTQYVRNNPWYELRSDVVEMLEAGAAALDGISAAVFECSWLGNFLLEICDKISLETDEGGSIESYVVDDVLTYDGTLSQSTRWSYTESVEETEENPTNITETMRATYARVNRLDNNITLVANETEQAKSAISTLQLNTDGINASVERLERGLAESNEQTNNELQALSQRVDLSMSSEDVQIQINSAMEQGVSKVETSTGFTFDENGLHISKTDSEMESTLDEDGLEVRHNGTEVLSAKSDGVNALNLTARQYFIIGGSRFEAYGNRTGCFWVGG
jgi:hypothetical protein